MSPAHWQSSVARSAWSVILVGKLPWSRKVTSSGWPPHKAVWPGESIHDFTMQIEFGTLTVLSVSCLIWDHVGLSYSRVR